MRRGGCHGIRHPGHFFKYDLAAGKLVDLGVPASPASYWLGSAVGPDGKFYVGTYPSACLARIIAHDKSLERAMGFFVTPEQTLYYGAGARLMRVRLDGPMGAGGVGSTPSGRAAD